MERLFKKNETFCTIAFIMIYVLLNSYLIQNYGFTSIQSVMINTVLSLLLIVFIIRIHRVEYYGLTKPKYVNKFIYFIPLFLISLFNLRNGFHIKNTSLEIFYHILTMINIGFLEEIIFRGFLFKMMEKDNVKTAILVSSLTFGIGHIVNLLNGADFVPTLLQVCYAIAIGYMLVIIFYKSQSIIPCIIFHMIFNALSIFSQGSSAIGSSFILIALCLGYTIFIQIGFKKSNH